METYVVRVRLLDIHCLLTHDVTVFSRHLRSSLLYCGEFLQVVAVRVFVASLYMLEQYLHSGLSVDVVLLLGWRPAFQPSHSGEPSAVFCSGSTDPCRIQTGDTCWDIAQGHGFSVDELQAAKRELVCSKLIPGGVMGPPSGSSENSRWKWLVVYYDVF